MLQEKFIKLVSRYSDNKNYNSICWNEIEDNYSSKSRHYHNINHLENMITELDKVETEIKDLDTLLFSIFYHDIIYKTTKSNNEYQSALLFEKRMSKTSFKKLNACVAQILATKEHKLSNDNDTNFLLDIDLSVLGKKPDMYLEYYKNIRKEYKIYPDFMYRKGRKKVLKSLLNLDSIYKTDFFREAYENQAKKNLTLELNQL